MPSITNRDRERAKTLVSRLADVERRVTGLEIPEDGVVRMAATRIAHEIRLESVDEMLRHIPIDVLGSYGYDVTVLRDGNLRTLWDVRQRGRSLAGSDELVRICAEVDRLHGDMLAAMPVVLGTDTPSRRQLELLKTLYQVEHLMPLRFEEQSLAQGVSDLSKSREKVANIPGTLRCLIMGEARRTEIRSAIDVLEVGLPRLEAGLERLDGKLKTVVEVDEKTLSTDAREKPEHYLEMVRSHTSIEASSCSPAFSSAWLIRLGSIREDLHLLGERLGGLSAPDATQRRRMAETLGLRLRHEHALSLLAQVDAGILATPFPLTDVTRDDTCRLTLAEAFEDGGVEFATRVGAARVREALDMLSRLYLDLFERIPCRVDPTRDSPTQDELMRLLVLGTRQTMLASMRERLLGRCDAVLEETQGFLGAATLFESLFMGEGERREKALRLDALAGRVSALHKDTEALVRQWNPPMEAVRQDFERSRDHYDLQIAPFGPTYDTDSLPRLTLDRARRIERVTRRMADVLDMTSRCAVPNETYLLAALDRCSDRIRWERVLELLDEVPFCALERFGTDVASADHATAGSYARDIWPEIASMDASCPGGTGMWASDAVARMAHALYDQVSCMDAKEHEDEDATELICLAVSVERAGQARERLAHLVALTDKAERSCARLPDDLCHTLFMSDRRRVVVERMLLSAEAAVERAIVEADSYDDMCSVPTSQEAYECFAGDSRRYLSLIRSVTGSPCDDGGTWPA